MPNIQMSTFTVGDKTYEVVDEQARKIAENAQPKGEYITQTQLEEAVEEAVKDLDVDVDLSGLATKEELDKVEEKIPDVPEWAKQPNKPSYTKEDVGLSGVANERQYSANNPPPYPVLSVNGQTGDVEVEPKGTGTQKVAEHNTSDAAHSDIRLILENLITKVNTLLDSDDTTLDQTKEIVAYIKANRELLESVTTNKVNVADIIDNLTTSVSNKPLSAKQGVQLKALIDAIKMPTKLSELTDDSTHRTVTDTEKTSWNNKSDFSGKYEDLQGRPTNLSDFENDEGYITDVADFYGVCGTAADVAAKEVMVGKFELKEGAVVIVKFSDSNSASSPTLNVNGTGAKPIYRYGTTTASTGTTSTGWTAGAVQMFIYDGTGYIRDYWSNTTYSNVALGHGYATCSTAAATAAKTVSLSSYALTTGGMVSIKFTNDVPASATLNINSKGAKAIYYRGAKITADVIKAGDTATFVYSTYYHLISIDRHIGEDYVTEEELNAKGYLKEEDKAGIVADVAASITTPDYIKTEAERLSAVVMTHQSENSFSIAFTSDMHVGYKAKNEATGKYELQNQSTIDAAMALEELGKTCLVDMLAFGGDYSSGSYESTREATKEDVNNAIEWNSKNIHNQPTAYLLGNHDTAPYMATADRLKPQELYAFFNRKNVVNGAVIDTNNASGCYGYFDFDNRKMRVIYLNTDDKAEWKSTQVGSGQTNNFLDAGNISAQQLDWMANIALDFSTKENVAEWGIIILSHRPLNETSGTYTDSTSGISYAYNITNAVDILTAFITKSSGTITHNGIPVNYDFSALEEKPDIWCCIHGHSHAYRYAVLGGKEIPSIGCPNVLSGRERVSTDGNTYTKTAGTAESTAFCVVTIDRRNKKLYADHYGAGVDRVWDWVKPTEDVPPAYTNLLPISTDIDGNIYNGKGFKEDLYLSGGNEATKAGYKVTGFIPITRPGGTGSAYLYLKNAGFSTADDYCRLHYYDANKASTALQKATVFAPGASGASAATLDENGNVIKVALNQAYGLHGGFIRLCGPGINENTILTINEEITD